LTVLFLDTKPSPEQRIRRIVFITLVGGVKRL